LREKSQAELDNIEKWYCEECTERIRGEEEKEEEDINESQYDKYNKKSNGDNF
jgi:hypothetical protein